jgi:hypothetical protein
MSDAKPGKAEKKKEPVPKDKKVKGKGQFDADGAAEFKNTTPAGAKKGAASVPWRFARARSRRFGGQPG